MFSSKLRDNIKTVLITGGSGLVGTRLSQVLAKKNYTVTHLSRKPTGQNYESFYWNVKDGEIESDAITSADAIIHLAGASVADKRWDESRKKEIYDSRIDSTKLLFYNIRELNPNLKYFLSASAIGYYGWDTGSSIVDETTEKGKGFLADVVEDWENEVSKFDELNIPNGKVRVGVVLSEKGGALAALAKPIRYGVGAILDSGEQYLSWIHLDDLCGIFFHLLDNKLRQTVNGVAPNPVTNKELTKAIAKKIKKPVFLPNVPKFALKLLLGEIADMLVGGNNVSSKKIEQLGYSFQYTELDQALTDLL
ncbi:MAG: TIGR01777 family oxidoreductase [Bacteroidota bacterium]